jgi:histidinol-phosphate aminotransferase
MSAHFRAALDAIAGYKAGARPTGTEDVARLASNEVPFGPLPGVQEAAAAALADSYRYPDPAATGLRAALAAKYGVTPERVGVGTGSVGLLQSLVQLVVDQGDEVIYAWRSFEAYPVIVRVVGGTPVEVPLTATAEHDLEAMAAAVTDRTRMVLLCSPNNPTGPALRQADVARFLDGVRDDVLVVLDEAYAEFVIGPECVDGTTLLDAHPNLIVLRTFSKAYGLAGLRVGYCLADPLVVAGLNKTGVPFGVNVAAQAAAIASLAAEDAMRERAERVRKERERLRAGLLDLGVDVPVSEGNFVWLPLGSRSGEYAAAMAERGILVRPYGDDGVRITVGTDKDVDRVLEASEPLLS